MNKQVKNGKAFEYACASNLYIAISILTDVKIVENSSYRLAKQYFEEFSDKEQKKLTLAARATIKSLFRLEPKLTNSINKDFLEIIIQEDQKGISGDVRDVLFVRKKDSWEIGISVKHNHSAVKHSRLSKTLDFGKKWFDLGCSDLYFEEIKPLFDKLELLKQKHINWHQVSDKANRFYVPLLQSFISEIKRIDKTHPSEIPSKLLEYLLGRNDFYKVISRSDKRMTQIQAFSLHGTLNHSVNNIKPQQKIKQLRLPSKIYFIDFKPESNNTIHIVMDQGWQLSLRIHSASTKVEPSLKFDIKLIGQPDIYNHFEPWQE